MPAQCTVVVDYRDCTVVVDYRDCTVVVDYRDCTDRVGQVFMMLMTVIIINAFLMR